MPVTIIGQQTVQQPQFFAAPIFEIKRRWTDQWQFAPDLELDYCAVHASSSSVSQLQVKRRFGNVKRTFESAFSQQASKNLNGWWVRFRVMSPHGPITQFVGIFKNQAKSLQGSPTLQAGEQSFIAYGGLHLLQNLDISGAYFTDGLGGSGVRKVDWLPSMNSTDRHSVDVGNAHNGTGTNPPVYGGTDKWTHYSYLFYLVTRFIQQTNGPQWSVGGQINALRSMETTIHFPQQIRASDLLRELVPVKYGLDYQIIPTEKGFEISIFSLSNQPGTIAGVSMPVNPNTVEVIKSTQLDLFGVDVVESTERRTDRIVVQGKRITVCGSLRGSRVPGAGGQMSDTGASTLVPKWTAALELQYLTADGITNTIPQPDETQWAQARSRDKFNPVYSDFGAPNDWDMDGGKWSIACKDDGSITTGSYQTAQRETLAHIPLKEGFDYSVNPPLDQTDGTHLPEQKYPLAWVYNEAPQDGSTPAYKPAHLAGFSIHHPYRDWGVKLNASPNEKLALNHWTDDYIATSPSGGQHIIYDYRTIIATIAIESDHRLQVSYKVPANLAAGDGSVMTVTDDGAEMWVLLPGTVVDVDQTGNLKTSGDAMQVIRNDLPRIALLAAGLITRYISSRYRVQMDFKGHMPWGTIVGSILDTITQGNNKEKVSSPITSIEWRGGTSPTTLIKTGYA